MNKNSMESKIAKGGPDKIEIAEGVFIDVWVKYDCEFETIPLPKELLRNKKRMKRYLEGNLLGCTNGELFSLIIHWSMRYSDPTKYRVVVAVYETVPPGPGGGTPPPVPAPPPPGKM